jgi:hypothetical protein
MPINTPVADPETLSKNEIKWLDGVIKTIAGETITRKQFLINAAMIVRTHTNRTILETYESNLEKSHDRENKEFYLALKKSNPNFWDGYPSSGKRPDSKASQMSAADYEEMIAKRRIGRIFSVLVRNGVRKYGKPALRS